MPGMASIPGRRRLGDEEMADDESDLVQFDTMEGNIGYSMWRAEQMDWHTFDDYADDDDGEIEGAAFADYGEYRNFGNFVHYFDTFELDWNNADNWDETYDLQPTPLLQISDDTVSMEMA